MADKQYADSCWDKCFIVPVLPVLQVHWLRLVLDEGHTLGALAATNKMTCAVNLRAGRRCALIS